MIRLFLHLLTLCSIRSFRWGITVIAITWDIEGFINDYSYFFLNRLYAQLGAQHRVWIHDLVWSRPDLRLRIKCSTNQATQEPPRREILIPYLCNTHVQQSHISSSCLRMEQKYPVALCIYETHAEIVQKREKGLFNSVVLGKNFHISNRVSYKLTYYKYRLLCRSFMVEDMVILNCLTLSF